MARFCFPTILIGKRRKSKEIPNTADLKIGNGGGALQVMPEDFISQSIKKGTKVIASADLADLSIQGSRSSDIEKCNKKVLDEKFVSVKTEVEAAYEGGDEHDDILSMKRDYSDLDLQALADTKDQNFEEPNGLNSCVFEQKSDREYEENTPELAIQSGHVSDPGMGRTAAFLGSPVLQRSCSNIETKRTSQLPTSPDKLHSYNDLQALLGNVGGDSLFNVVNGSPRSVISKCSADKVMLKKRSSSQVLPSRSRKLWWKLFLWSHRNLHKLQSYGSQRLPPISNISSQKGGYSSDTLEPKLNEKKALKETENMMDGGMWPQNQWVAFSVAASPFDRVNAWVNSLVDGQFCPVTHEFDNDGEAGEFPILSSFEIGESSGKNQTPSGRRVPEEVAQANTVIQSLNSFSTVAHISGMGLKVIPSISAFSSLRAVNLSGNFIVHITPGSLPKSLHVLDLSRNRISTIEGLRELTRLRVLNLSYNRISRIGHGLSNCCLIKELYLAGNKISDVEGLHRLLKLTVLDLSFNKITTTKALGQLVANYSSLQALNLVGNPIQTNIGDDQLRKAVCSLLPHLVYLNRQPIKPQRAREVATDSVAKAALGSSGWSSRRRAARKSSHGLNSLVVRGSTSSVSGQRGSNRLRSRNRHHQSSSMKK